LAGGKEWYSGIYRSTDLGKTWEHAYFDTINMDLQIKYLGAAGRALFASTKNGGFLRSLDCGRTWVELNNRPPLKSFYWLAALTVFGDYTYFASKMGGGIIRSRDLGETWESLNAGLVDTSVYALAVSGNTIYAGTYNSGVLISNDSGKTWRKSDSGLPDIVNPSFAGKPTVEDILVLPNGILIATGDGLFLSNSDGTNWEKVLVNPKINLLAVDKLLMSTSGKSFAATPRGIFCSATAQSWQVCNSGLQADIIESISLYSNRLIASSYYWSVFSSDNNGQTWLSITPEPIIPSASVTYSGKNCLYIAGTQSILRARNTDFNWEPFSQNLQSRINGYVFSIVELDTFVFASGESGILRRGPQDTSWTDITGPLNRGALSLATNNGRLFAAGALGVWVSDDYGMTWQNKINITDGGFKSIVAQEGEAYAAWGVGTAGSIYRSFDNGNNWQEMAFQLPRMEELALRGNSLFAATLGFGVYASHDSSRTWTQINDGLTNPVVQCLAGNDSFLFAGTVGSSVFKLNLAHPNSCKQGIAPPKSTMSLDVCRISSGIFRVKYRTGAYGPVRIMLYNVAGRRMSRLLAETQPAGAYEILMKLPSHATGSGILELETRNMKKSCFLLYAR